jgi:transcriptional regulator with XRE-family HTH domain
VAGIAPVVPCLASLAPELYRACLRRLVAARREAGLTQQQLADRIGQRQTFISKIELAERRLDVAEFVLLCRALGADASTLLTEQTEDGG